MRYVSLGCHYEGVRLSINNFPKKPEIFTDYMEKRTVVSEVERSLMLCTIIENQMKEVVKCR